MEDIKKTIFKDIYTVINKIKKCKSKSTYTILINELYTLYNLCDHLEITDYPKLENYSIKNIKCDNKGADLAFEIYNNLDYHLEFAKKNKNINRDKYLNPDSFIINKFFNTDDFLYIISDFLNEYDPKLLKIFNDMLEEGRIFKLNISNNIDEDIHTPAFTTCSFGSFKPYIVIEMENSVPDLINIVHELANTKEYLNTSIISTKVLKQKENNCLEEVHSYFLQNLFIKYLEKIRFNPKDVETAKLGYNYTFSSWIKKLYESLKDLKEELYFDHDLVDYLNYTYGIAIGYHFIDRYLSDPKEAKKQIDDFIIFNGQYNMMELLEKFNLKDEIIKPKILKKYL